MQTDTRHETDLHARAINGSEVGNNLRVCVCFCMCSRARVVYACLCACLLSLSLAFFFSLSQAVVYASKVGNNLRNNVLFLSSLQFQLRRRRLCLLFLLLLLRQGLLFLLLLVRRARKPVPLR